MTPWLEWGSLFGATLAATVLAISYYFHWSWRYQRRNLGVTAEVSAMLLIVLLGAAGIFHLLGHMPK
jgi:hypothetical protein